jgi:hypothetical protein
MADIEFSFATLLIVATVYLSPHMTRGVIPQDRALVEIVNMFYRLVSQVIISQKAYVMIRRRA